MVKETMKAKIERLEGELKSANEMLTESCEGIQKLNNEITQLKERADESFEDSPMYLQMKKQIKLLELKNKSLEDTIKHNKKVHKLINEKKHNERGAGRKTRFTDGEIETIKLYRIQGMTIKHIAEVFECSVGLIHKLVN